MTLKKKKPGIVMGRRGEFFTAALEGRDDIVGYGLSEQSAIGNMMVVNQNKLGIHVDFSAIMEK